ncbi:MAG TPA: hypothetical protein VHE08_08530 [Solirubrobacterales bacterium]|nr:hypothetical protein [Solirubrobacterales bacterium]
MKTLARLSRRPVTLLLVALLLVPLGLKVGSAGATPAISPPIETQSPPDGSSVDASGEALKVTFSCPAFTYEKEEVREEENEEGEVEKEVIPAVLGGAEEYGVHFSTYAGVVADGQLGTYPFGEAGEGESKAIKPINGSCTSEFELPSKPYPAALYEGRIYWQAYRESCTCTGGTEVGPVNSFVVVPHVEEPELSFREQIFAGYLTKIEFDYEAELGGSTVFLQMWEGSLWNTVAEAPGSKAGENAFFVKVKEPGHHLFRPAVLGGGPPLYFETAKKVIRKPPKKRVTGPDEDGAYVAAGSKEREESPIRFSVAKGGTVLRNLKTEAETVCKGPTRAQNVTIEVNAYLRNARIAPDGTVFGVTKSKGPEPWTVTLAGSIFDGRFQGRLSTSRTNCTGYRTIDAILARTVKR